jgi:hypothetical protein
MSAIVMRVKLAGGKKGDDADFEAEPVDFFFGFWIEA